MSKRFAESIVPSSPDRTHGESIEVLRALGHKRECPLSVRALTARSPFLERSSSIEDPKGFVQVVALQLASFLGGASGAKYATDPEENWQMLGAAISLRPAAGVRSSPLLLLDSQNRPILAC